MTGHLVNNKGVSAPFGTGKPLMCVNDRIGYVVEKPDVIAKLNDGDVTCLMDIVSNGQKQGVNVINLQLMRQELNERLLLPRLTERVMDETDALIAIDSRDPEAIESCLRLYAPGRAMCNFINGEKENLRTLLPLVAKYNGVAATALVDERGVPYTVAERLSVARNIIDAAKANGIPAQDVIIDGVCLPAGVVIGSPKETLLSIRAIKEELGVPVLLGLSNISYMMPMEGLLDLVYLIMAAGYGMDVAMVDPDMPNFPIIKDIVDLYTGADPYGKAFIKRYRQQKNSKEN